MSYESIQLANQQYVVTGTVDGKPVRVAIPKGELMGPDGQSLDQPSCEAVIEAALLREAAGEAQPWAQPPDEGEKVGSEDEATEAGERPKRARRG